MRGDLLDLVLLVVALLFAVSGYRQGFVVGALSFVGFLGGGLIGAQLAPHVAGLGPLKDLNETVIGLGVVFLCAGIGQALAALVGSRLRAGLTWRPARLVDAATGALVSVVSLLLVAWLIGTAVASAPYPSLASQVRRSVVIGTVDALVPRTARKSVSGLRDFIDERGFPDVFGGLDPTRTKDVAAPDPTLAKSRAVQRARPDVLKVTGVAPSCRRRIEGTGFVYAPERVMTNAHVVAGVREPLVEVGGKQLAARVVLFDPGRDVAVLQVPGLANSPLSFAGPADDGDSAVVVGYPKDGPFRADPARIRQTQRARGPDIYDDETVVREIYALRGLVQPGNSGGPLIDTRGRVLGVVFAAAADRRDTGYALTAEEVASDAAQGRTATERVGSGPCD